MNANGPVQDPDLRALLNAHRDEIFASLNSVRVGTIASFDAETQTATVRINAQAVVFNQAQPTDEGLQQTPSVLDYPVLTDVPVFFPTGGGASLRLPVASGDTCAVLFNDRDMDAWFATGTIAAPNSPRMHSLSDGLAIVGFRSLANAVDGYSATDAELVFGSSKIAIRADGTIVLVRGNASMTITPAGEIDLLSSGSARLALKADGTAVLNFGSAKFVANPDGTIAVESAGGAKVDLGTLVGISNGATSLLTALDLVVTALTALNAKTGPTAAPQIAAAQASITSLLA